MLVQVRRRWNFCRSEVVMLFTFLLLCLTPFLNTKAVAQNKETRLLRFPDIHGNQVVFTYAGDLWIASTDGGTARRLTAHPGVELFAKFSPDGKQIAFTGQYDGDEQVYVIPAEGGVPKQLTYYPALGPLPPRWGYDNQVYGWTPDGKSVLFRSVRDSWGLSETKLYTASLKGGLPKSLPMPQSGAGDYSPDGKKVVYSPLFRDFRTWKRYQGGWAQNLYVFNLGTNEVEQITNHPRTERDPMWIGDKIYFASDRDGKLNLYSYTISDKTIAQLTHNTKWDVRWPSADEQGRIVYEQDGQLHIFDANTNENKKLAIYVPDDGLAKRPSHIKVNRNIEDYSISPNAKTALFVARGDIFTVPVEKGITRNLTQSSNAHDKWARWSPDGKQIVFISDMSGEEELYLMKPDGTSKPEQLTHNGKAMRYNPEWSADGKFIAFSDKDGKLYLLNMANRNVRQVADEPQGQLRDYTWSPKGTFLAYSLSEKNGMNSIYIYDAQSNKNHRVSNNSFNQFNPSWDPDGKYLFYLSDREFAPQIGSIEWNYVTDRETNVYAVALRKDVPNLFPPEGMEEVQTEKKVSENGSKNKKAKKNEPKESLQIDFDGLGDRVMLVPVAADNYLGLIASKGNIILGKGGPFYYGRFSDIKPSVEIFNIKDRKTKTLAEGISGFARTPDGSHILLRQNGGFNLYDVQKGKGSKKNVSVSDLTTYRVPAEEWAQIFDEVWRRYRDFFYVNNMHGYDWKALHDQYKPLLKYVAHRSDLNYVISEMIAELSVSHAYISGGDFEIPDRPDVALLGARLTLDENSGKYRIAHIFKGDNAEKRYRSPLKEVGINASEGDYILAIDGHELKANDNPYRMLRFKSKQPVELTLNSKPDFNGSRKIMFNPVSSESNLVYLEWTNHNREMVDKMSNGRFGYLHIPDMGSNGIREFIKWYYPQIKNKEGLVVDVRSNGGGNVSQMLIERLRRKLLAAQFARTSDVPNLYPSTVFPGHLVCLINETSASDGDIFPAMFKKANLGPLIGKRSWGGVIGITNRGTLIDGGSVNVPEFGFLSAKGDWIIEGHGVDPDIVVENDPKAVIEGRDPQLERGVAELTKLAESQPVKLLVRPAPPVKND